MASWRDRASEQAQEDMTWLVDEGQDQAKKLLTEQGGFNPFAIVIGTDGARETVNAQGDRVSLDDLVGALVQRRDTLRAAVVVQNASTPEVGDCLHVDVESAEGVALAAAIPWRKRRIRKGYDFGDINPVTPNHNLWGPAETETETVTPDRELRIVVLRERSYPGVGAALDVITPGGSERLDVPQADTASIRMNGVDVTLQVSGEPLAAPELAYAVQQSPQRARVEPLIQQHGAYVVVTVDAGDDLFAGLHMLVNLGAYFADDGGLVVWTPDADMVSTVVMYLGELDERPAVLTFNTVAASLDSSTAIAHTIGLQSFGGMEVQLRSTIMDPVDAYLALRGAVATAIEEQQLPLPGTTMVIAGVPHTLAPAASMLGLGAILDAVPGVAAPA